MNSLAHYVGNPRYNPEISARVHWVEALLRLGEGDRVCPVQVGQRRAITCGNPGVSGNRLLRLIVDVPH